MITIILIVIEIIIFSICFHINSDIAVDIANLTISLITLLLAVYLYTAKVEYYTVPDTMVINTSTAGDAVSVVYERGHNYDGRRNPFLKVTDYFCRDDLVEEELRGLNSGGSGGGVSDNTYNDTGTNNKV